MELQNMFPLCQLTCLLRLWFGFFSFPFLDEALFSFQEISGVLQLIHEAAFSALALHLKETAGETFMTFWVAVEYIVNRIFFVIGMQVRLYLKGRAREDTFLTFSSLPFLEMKLVSVICVRPGCSEKHLGTASSCLGVSNR